jgi:hypothetical protein
MDLLTKLEQIIEIVAKLVSLRNMTESLFLGKYRLLLLRLPQNIPVLLQQFARRYGEGLHFGSV